jgi:HlyD family secretion protein
MRRRIIILAAALSVSIAVAATFLVTRNSAQTVEFVTAPASTGSIRTVVNATGTLQPVVTVQIGAQISGQVQEIYADFNTIVKPGQLLARIDPRNFQAQLTNSQAKVEAARAAVRNAEAQKSTTAADIRAAQAGIAEAQAELNNTQTLYQRAQELNAKGLLSQNDFDVARTNFETAGARYKQAQAAAQLAQAKLAGAEAQIEQVRAQLAQAEADLKQAQVNLEYTNIYSPVDGVVISLNVDVGQTIASSLQAPTLFTIANDLTQMQVNASIDEADIGNISNTAAVRFTVDAYPGETFRGRIHEIRLNPSTVQNVVTYNAILDIENPELKLKPGMTANISITVEQREQVLKVPNLALRYAPPGNTVKPIVVASDVMDEAGTEPPAPQPETPSRVVAPGQKWDPADKLQVARSRHEVLRSGHVWVLNRLGTPEERSVLLGITDGTSTEVVSGGLQEGDPIIVGDSTKAEGGQKLNTTTNPLFPRTGGRRRF